MYYFLQEDELFARDVDDPHSSAVELVSRGAIRVRNASHVSGRSIHASAHRNNFDGMSAVDSTAGVTSSEYSEGISAVDSAASGTLSTTGQEISSSAEPGASGMEGYSSAGISAEISSSDPNSAGISGMTSSSINLVSGVHSSYSERGRSSSSDNLISSKQYYNSDGGISACNASSDATSSSSARPLPALPQHLPPSQGNEI